MVTLPRAPILPPPWYIIFRYTDVSFPSNIQTTALYGSRGVGGANILDRQRNVYLLLDTHAMNRGINPRHTGFKVKVAIMDDEEPSQSNHLSQMSIDHVLSPAQYRLKAADVFDWIEKHRHDERTNIRHHSHGLRRDSAVASPAHSSSAKAAPLQVPPALTLPAET